MTRRRLLLVSCFAVLLLAAATLAGGVRWGSDPASAGPTSTVGPSGRGGSPGIPVGPRDSDASPADAPTAPLGEPEPEPEPEPAPLAGRDAVLRPAAAEASRPAGAAPTASPPPAPSTAPPGSGQAVIGPEGGSVSVATPGLPATVLTVPAGALSRPTTITVTPTTDFSHPALAAPVAGVDLEPSGLVFAVPATLDLAVPESARTAPLAAVLWETDPRLGQPVAWSPGPAGTVRIEIPHFSGAGVGGPTIAGCAAVATAHPEASQPKTILAAYLAQFGAGTPMSVIEPSLVATMATWHHAAVIDFVETADSPPEFLDAARRMLEWQGVLQCLGLTDDPSLDQLSTASKTTLQQTGQSLGARYLLPTCNALASDIRDWVRTPLDIAASLTLLALEQGPALEAASGPGPDEEPRHRPFCLRAVVHEVDAPEHIGMEERYVDVTVAVRLEVVAQGGDLAATPQRIDLGQFLYLAEVEGGTITGGQTVAGATDAVGRVTLTVDRGADEESRTPTVRVSFDAVRNFPGVELDFTNPTATSRVVSASLDLDLRPEPSLTAVLQPVAAPIAAGATVDLCVQVTDEVDDAAAGAVVTFEIDGPGSLAQTQATTQPDGRACVAYTSSEDGDAPADLAIRAVATRDDVTSEAASATVPVAPGEQKPEEPVDPDEPQVFGSLAGTLTDGRTFFRTRAIENGTQVIDESTVSTLTLAITADQLTTMRDSGARLPVSVSGSSVTKNSLVNTFGVPGHPGEVCVITREVSRTVVVTSGTAALLGDGRLSVTAVAEGTQTTRNTVTGPVALRCVRQGVESEQEVVAPSVQGLGFELSPVVGPGGQLTGYVAPNGEVLLFD